MTECNHINLIKQVGSLDGGPAKSTRYRCALPPAIAGVSEKIEAVARLWYGTEPERGLRERLAEGLIGKLKEAILPALAAHETCGAFLVPKPYAVEVSIGDRAAKEGEGREPRGEIRCDNCGEDTVLDQCPKCGNLLKARREMLRGRLAATQPPQEPAPREPGTFTEWWNSHAGPKNELAKGWAEAAWIAANRVMPNIDALAAEIRRVDGSHSLGAGALAEKLTEWMRAVAQPPQELVSLREAAVEEYKRSLDVPELEDFNKGVLIEAQHQRQRWGDDHDKTKEPEEWFWVVGYLAGKALRAQRDGDMEKFKHHLITGAALLSNWHARARAALTREAVGG